MKNGKETRSNKNRRNSTSSRGRMAQANSQRYKADAEKEGHNGKNDAAWYFKYPEILNAAAKVPFVNYPGTMLNGVVELANKPSSIAYFSDDISIPGLISIEWIPTLGMAKEQTDPINLTAKELYAQVRKNFSGSIVADAPDMVIHVLAQDSIYAYIAYLKRIFRALNTYSPKNMLMPRAILMACGFNDKSIAQLQEQKTELFGYINTLIRMVNKFVVPEKFSLMDRHYLLCDGVYADGPVINAKMYQFTPRAFFKFALKNTPDEILAGGLELVPIKWNNDSATLAIDLFNYGKSLIDALASWEETYDINGYFLKAFGETKFVVDPLTMDEKVELHYDQEILMQIHNLNSLPHSHLDTEVMTFACDVSQDPKTNILITDPQITITGLETNVTGIFTEAGILDLPYGIDSPEYVVEATRLKATHEVLTNTPTAVTIRVKSATEAVTGVRHVYTWRGANNELVTGNYGIPVGSYWNMNNMTDNMIASVGRLMNVSGYEWFPLIPIIYSNGSSAYSFLWGKTNQITHLDDVLFDNINRICLYSMFNSFGA